MRVMERPARPPASPFASASAYRLALSIKSAESPKPTRTITRPSDGLAWAAAREARARARLAAGHRRRIWGGGSWADCSAQAHRGSLARLRPRSRVRAEAPGSKEFGRRGLMGRGVSAPRCPRANPENNTAPRTAMTYRGAVSWQGRARGRTPLKPLEGRRRHPAQTKLVANRKSAYRQKYQYCAGGLLIRREQHRCIG
jgi:hypothetical protein